MHRFSTTLCSVVPAVALFAGSANAQQLASAAAAPEQAAALTDRAQQFSLSLPIESVASFGTFEGVLSGDAIRLSGKLVPFEGGSPSTVRVDVRKSGYLAGMRVVTRDVVMWSADGGEWAVVLLPSQEAGGTLHVSGPHGVTALEYTGQLDAATAAVMVAVLEDAGPRVTRSGQGGLSACDPSFGQCVNAAKAACDTLEYQVTYTCERETGAVSCSWTCVPEASE